MFGINIKTLRQFYGWDFAFLSVLCAVLGVQVILRTMRFQRAASSHPVVFLLYAVLPSAAVVFGVAWWKIWKQRPPARTWGIGACILLALHPLWRVMGTQGSVHSYNIIVLAIAIVGLIAFSKRDKAPLEQGDQDQEDPRYKGV
jgi:ABC-type Mn2+/Zn2+ transport system permease subunit